MPSMDTKALGLRVKAAREGAGLNQARLAEAVGVTDETISRLERGAFEPALSTLAAVADELGLSLDVLVDREWAGGAVTPREAIVRRISARAERLTPEAQRVLLDTAELMPVREEDSGKAAATGGTKGSGVGRGAGARKRGR